jgi:hypothetical protein
VLAAFGALPDIVTLDPERLWTVRALDLGPDAHRGVGRYPAQEGQAYPSYAAAVDRDGNEMAGIRLPDLVVPVGTHTGWNPRAPETGAPEQMISMQGFSNFFAPTRATREAIGDPRPSLEERYANLDAYLAQVREVTQRLATERYILETDIDIVIEACVARYDVAMSAVAVSAS